MSSRKVVGLRGQEVSDGREPNAAAVEVARDLLARVESGEIVGFVAAAVYFDGGTGRFRGGLMSYGMVGTLEELKLQMLEVLR